MPQAATTWPSVQAAEIRNPSIDGSPDMGAGSGLTIVSATVTLTVADAIDGAVDPAPQSRLNRFSIVGQTVVMSIGPCIADITYQVTVLATASDGEIFEWWQLYTVLP